MMQVLHGDCLDLLDGVVVVHAEPYHHIEYLEVPEGGFDAVVCDPPYGIEFMGAVNDWDYEVPGPEYWKLVLQACKPGAHLVAFGGTRTFHRLTCAIEDSGWVIRDCLSRRSGEPSNSGFSGRSDKGWMPDEPDLAVMN